MIKTIMLLIIFSLTSYSNSLYVDNIQDVVNLENDQLNDAYNFSKDNTKKNALISADLSVYMQTIFKLSQLTSGLAHITDESKIYSDINRLDRICIELTQLLEKETIQFNFKPIGSISKLQAYYQETLYRLHVISPYLLKLLNSDQKKISYYIEYIRRISIQIESNIQEMIAIKQHLNTNPQSSLPFSPQTPQQLSFALENQLNSSIINMINTNGLSSDSLMPYAEISTPTNTGVFNQGLPQGLPNVPSPNASPLQMMNYIPTF